MVGRRAAVEAAAYQDDDALPDEAADFVLAARRQAQFRQRAVAGLGEVGDGVEQRAVEIEGDRFEMHQTLASSLRRAPMIES
mgnify:CR=1 FL=1